MIFDFGDSSVRRLRFEVLQRSLEGVDLAAYLPEPNDAHRYAEEQSRDESV